MGSVVNAGVPAGVIEPAKNSLLLRLAQAGRWSEIAGAMPRFPFLPLVAGAAFSFLCLTPCPASAQTSVSGGAGASDYGLSNPVDLSLTNLPQTVAPLVGVPQVAVKKPPALYNSVRTTRPVVALTFDDGPHGTLTPKLLDILRVQGVRATFFVLGENVERYPDIARRIVAEGHEIANHSWDHPSLPRVSAERLDRELRRTTEIIEKTTGQKVTMMRPTYGALNDRVEKSLLEDYKLDVILWSVDPRDWKRPGADVVTRRMVGGAHPGAILLAHDIHPGTIAAMPDTIAQLKAKGYSFATVSELLTMDEPPSATNTPPPAAARPRAYEPSISVTGGTQ